mmetsp:Transcript_10174/g.41207  ORF Transcript_10174/g.41207 Transcript_10174/m.41207 type:complete len:85 (-) Transcript_10174:958-1212(-)
MCSETKMRQCRSDASALSAAISTAPETPRPHPTLSGRDPLKKPTRAANAKDYDIKATEVELPASRARQGTQTSGEARLEHATLA